MTGKPDTSALISHVGIAVFDLKAAIAAYRLITGSEPLSIEEVAEQQVRVAMFAAGGPGGSRVELLEATSDSSPISRFLAKRGEGLHHICLYVDDIEKRLEELKKAGVRLIDEIPRRGAEGRRIAFLHPESSHGVLIELEERDPKN